MGFTEDDELDLADDIDYYPNELSDTRDEGYCWRVVDEDGEIVTHLTMDWSAYLYEEGMDTDDEIRIIFWDV